MARLRPFRKKKLKLWASLLTALVAGATLAAQERGPVAVSPADLRAAVGKLGNLDYATRVAAARTVRRAPAAQAVPVLLDAVSGHEDGYIRFRSLVLLTGFNDPRTVDAMEESLSSPNDRLREVAYRFFEHNPEPALIPRLLAALDKEEGEFVRPTIIRALAAQARDPRVRDVLLRDSMRGVDFFRSIVIEAIGDYRVTAALPRLLDIARLDGPLQDDAVLALGKIGDKTALARLAELQRSAPQVQQPSVAAAICLIGSNCSSHISYLEKTLGFAEDFPGYQELLRGSASGLGAIAVRGSDEAVKILFDVGVPSQDPVRAPVALALGLVALRNTPLMLKTLRERPDQAAAIGLVAEGFDMLEEDLDEERFFATVRKTYWASPDGSPVRKLCEQVISRLDF